MVPKGTLAGVITVVSTGWNAPTKARCLASVREQRGVDAEHRYIEASNQPRPLSALANVTATVRGLAPDRIVAWLDGDDWLASPDALATVASVYARHPDTWLTYGSFVFDTGARGFAAPVATDAPRLAPWTATHLKTFRAGLFQRLTDLDLAAGGGEHCRDLVVMFPLLEMAGRERARFVPEILAVYSSATSWETSATVVQRFQEHSIAQELRRLPPKQRLACL